MANQIRLKRASGSDPGASDLVLGEPAVRTDTGEIFLKKDDGSIAKVAGGIDDGDKGDITVSSSGSTFTIDSGVVTSAKIANDTIVNADINSSAAIAGSKISPDFGSQDIATTGNINLPDSSSSSTGRIMLGDGSDMQLQHDGGGGFIGNFTGNLTVHSNALRFMNGAKTENFIKADANGAVELYHDNSKKCQTDSSGISVTGSIVVSGTVDGRDVASDGSKLDGIASGATNVTNTNQLTNGAGFITATLTNEQVQDIVGGMVTGNTESGITVTYQDGDGTLDFVVGTLNQNTTGNAATATEATNVTAVANNTTNTNYRVPFLSAATGTSQLQSDNDGGMAYNPSTGTLVASVFSGSGASLTSVNAATLDSIDSSQFLRSDTSDTMTGDLTIGDGSADTRLLIKKADNNEADHIQFFLGSTRMGEIGSLDTTWLRINQETAKNIYTPRYIRADGGFFVDGASKGINGSGNFIGGTIAGASDYSSLLRSDTADTASGDITFNGGAGAVSIAANSDIRLINGTWSGNTTSPKIQAHDNVLYILGGSSGIIFRENATDRWKIDGSGHFNPATDSTYDIGASGTRVSVGYFDVLDSGRARINNGILETKATIADSQTLTSGFNAMAVSPTINSGVTVTVPSGAVFAII